MSVPDPCTVMLSESEHCILAEPISVGTKVMPNRLYRSPGLDVGREPWSTGPSQAGHGLGDWGTVMAGAWTVLAGHASEDRGRRWDASSRSALEQMCTDAHVRGALAGVVLRCGWPEDRAPSSAERHEMLAALDVIAQDARRIGCDIIHLSGGLPLQRSGEVAAAAGGVTEDTWRETIERVAAAVRDECAVAVEIHPTTEPAMIAQVDGAVDLWVVSFDDRDPDRARHTRAHTTKPLVGIGRFCGADRMVAAVQSGAVDVIGPVDAGPVIG